MPSVLLYTGHLVDGATAARPRLRAKDVPVLRQHIQQAVASVARPGWQAVGCLAAGADLLFAHAVLQAGLPLHPFLPFSEADFLRVSVGYPIQEAGFPHNWFADYHAAKHHPLTRPTNTPQQPFTHSQ